MLKYFIGLSLLTIACGCSQNGLEDEALDRKIDEIASSVNNSKQRYKSLDNLNDLLSAFRKCKTHERRRGVKLETICIPSYQGEIDSRCSG